VDTPFGPVCAPPDTALPAGPVTVGLRPEAIRPAADGTAPSLSAPVFRAQVVSGEFVGPVSRLELDGPQGLRLTAKSISRPGGEAVQVGETAPFTFEADALALLPGEAR
jgi:hypothetical protein